MDPISDNHGTPSDLDLKSIIDNQEIQAIMDDFHALTGMVTAILDLDGNVIEATGWQDICTHFHRVNPQTAAYCTESDLLLTKNLKPGQYADYKCKNGLWDVATPLYVGDRHLGNIYTGQFFYDDDQVDEEEFIRRAEENGFDKDAYMEAFRRIPRYSRESIDHLMGFLVKLTTHISRISLTNHELAKEIRIRKFAQEAWHESDAQLRALVRAIPDLVWLKDRQGVFLFCNSRFEDFFGAKESEIIGKTDHDFVDGELADFFLRHDKAAMAKGGPTKNEEEVVFASDGHTETLETIKTPLYRSDGQLAGVLGIGRDITERLRAERALLKSEIQLRKIQKMESIGRLAGGVAHDLNNLLTPILGYGQLLKGDIAPEDTCQESIDEILSAGSKARDLVHQLLAFSRKQTLEYESVDLNAALQAFENLLKRTIRANIIIEFALSPDLPLVMADIGQIEQVIMNLVINAADAMPECGGLTIETTTAVLDEALDDEGGELAPGRYVVLRFSDSGSGMDAEIADHLFEPFFSTKGELGTGLGLATVYGIVRQHGGTIRVQSEPGKGASFEVFLPASDSVARADDVEVLPATDLEGTETILLVEDNAQVRGLMFRVLLRQGYRVMAAGNGKDALAILDAPENSVDLLLTDLVMPGMTGSDLYRVVIEKHPHLKVIFMSGYSDEELMRFDASARNEKFLQKPINPRTLAVSVREVLDRANIRVSSLPPQDNT